MLAFRICSLFRSLLPLIILPGLPPSSKLFSTFTTHSIFHHTHARRCPPHTESAIVQRTEPDKHHGSGTMVSPASVHLLLSTLPSTCLPSHSIDHQTNIRTSQPTYPRTSHKPTLNRYRPHQHPLLLKYQRWPAGYTLIVTAAAAAASVASVFNLSAVSYRMRRLLLSLLSLAPKLAARSCSSMKEIEM